MTKKIPDDFSIKSSDEITQPIISTETLRRMTAQFTERKDTTRGMPVVERPPFRRDDE